MREMSPFFLILAAITVLGACAAMTLRSLVHCALALAVAFAGIGTLYLSLGAQFLGLAQLLVYVGAVAVLIVFVILLTQPSNDKALGASDNQALRAENNQVFGGPFKPAVGLSGVHLASGLLIAAAIFAILGWATLHSFASRLTDFPAPQVTIRQLGTTLMEHYIVTLEIIGLLLTAAMIGAVILAMKETQKTR
jgi:NADH:ubiquinone oxidoreductase subunit 6 (subunit J)